MERSSVRIIGNDGKVRVNGITLSAGQLRRLAEYTLGACIEAQFDDGAIEVMVVRADKSSAVIITADGNIHYG